ncbi:UNVERIFIED_CONTAM: RING-H2 finger protein ATL7 [Sesamum radiatum]
MSYSVKNTIPDQETSNNGTANAANCCSRASSQLKLYQAFIFSVPILFTFILLLLFYFFYLRPRRVDWSSLRMRTGSFMPTSESSDDISRCELGLKKELREMLPVIVFKESFSVKDTQYSPFLRFKVEILLEVAFSLRCSVCLGDYQAEDRLQQIPSCGHTFHMDCIDLWLATHTTCPLCRKSLLASTKSPCANGVPDSRVETNGGTCDEDPQTSQQP